MALRMLSVELLAVWEHIDDSDDVIRFLLIFTILCEVSDTHLPSQFTTNTGDLRLRSVRADVDVIPKTHLERSVLTLRF